MTQLTLKPRVVDHITYPFAYWDGLLSEDELKEIEKYCSKEGTDEATVMKSDGMVVEERVRISDVGMHHPNQENGWIFERFLAMIDHMNKNFYQYDLLGIDFFQYTEYNGEGSKYDFHMDMLMGEQVPPGMHLPRKLSFSLILSDNSEYEGGEFEIAVDGVNSTLVEQKRGRLLAFPSYVIHRVAPIKKGQRRSIVFWALGPKFK